MKYSILFILLLFVQLCNGQNNHYLMYGANHPISSSEPNIARGYGLEVGYQYSREFNKQLSISSGFRFDIYEKSKEESVALDILIPIKFGCTFNKITISAGLSLNVAQLMSVGAYNGSDPEIHPVYRSQYFDMNTMCTFGVGFNSSIEYFISRKNKLYIDFVRIKLNDKHLERKQYSYGILTIGLKHRLN